MDIGPQSTRLQLLRLLREGHALTQAEMTEHLPIDSKRQARRLVTELEEAGVPIEERRRGREKEYRLPPDEWKAGDVTLELTEREALALLLAAGAARSGLGPAPLSNALHGAFDGLIEALPASVDTFEPASLMDHLHFGEAASVEVNPALFMDFVSAISNRRSLQIDYHTARSDTFHEGRRIDPRALAVRGEAWLCVAYDHKSEELRDFNLSRVEDAYPYDASSNGGDYRIPDDFDLELYFIDRFEAMAGEEVFRVRLLVEPGCATYFRSKAYHRTQQIEEEREDGRLVVSYEVAGLEEIASFVRSWGPKVTVLDPPSLRQRIADAARAVAARYDAVSGETSAGEAPFEATASRDGEASPAVSKADTERPDS